MADASSLPAPIPPPLALMRGTLEPAGARIEKLAGGRRALVELLEGAPQTRDQEVLVGLIADPRTQQVPLAELLTKGRFKIAMLANLFASASLHLAQLEAGVAVAKHLPLVATQVMDKAIEGRKPCVFCEGKGQVDPPLGRESATPDEPPKAVTCAPCGGYGYVVWQPGEKQQRLALELGKLLKLGGGVNVSVNATAQAAAMGIGTVASSFVDALATASDTALDGVARARRAKGAATAADPIDVTPEAPGARPPPPESPHAP